MPKVTVTREFKWSPDGNTTQTETIGSVVEGRAADAALAMGCGTPVTEAPPPVEAKAESRAPENKAVQGAPRNKGR